MFTADPAQVILKNKMLHADSNCMLVDFKSDSFSVVLVRDNSLLTAQIFFYTKAEDVLYYLLNICKQFSITQNEVNILLSGLIDRNSTVFKELYQYFLNIDFDALDPRRH